MQAVPACVQIGKACRAAHRSMIHRILSAFGLSINHSLSPPLSLSQRSCLHFLDDDVYYRGYYMCWRLKLEGETENMSVCTKERKGVAAEVLMATPCSPERERRLLRIEYRANVGCLLLQYSTVRERGGFY